MALRHITKISDLSRKEIVSIMGMAMDMKANPGDYREGLPMRVRFDALTWLCILLNPSERVTLASNVRLPCLGRLC